MTDNQKTGLIYNNTVGVETPYFNPRVKFVGDAESDHHHNNLGLGHNEDLKQNLLSQWGSQ